MAFSEYNYILCERCKEYEAVCIWDLQDEYYGRNICDICCSELTKKRQKICRSNPMRRKSDPFRDINYAIVYLAYIGAALLIYAFCDLHWSYLKIFRLETFLSFACLTLLGHFSVAYLSHNKKKRKIHIVMIAVWDILFGLFGACATFSNRFRFDAMSVIIIASLILFIANIAALLFVKLAIKKGRQVPNNLITGLIITGFALSVIAMFLLAIRYMVEMEMLHF